MPAISEPDAAVAGTWAPARVLGVGIATLDLINRVADYPAEDSEVRALSQRRVRGGNVANSLDVLAQCGHDCAWLGVLGTDPASDFIRAELVASGIDTAWAVTHPGGVAPTSCIALSAATGSRTIVHYRDLPELDEAAFARVPLDGWDWVHFEWREPARNARMMARVREHCPGARLSVELEKPRAGSPDRPPPGADLLLASRGFAEAHGFPVPEPFLLDLAARCDPALAVVAWGASGAVYQERGGPPVWVAAHRAGTAIDTLGAGDVLNALVIDGCLRGLTAAATVQRAVRIAGLKCTREGFTGLFGEGMKDEG